MISIFLSSTHYYDLSGFIIPILTRNHDVDSKSETSKRGVKIGNYGNSTGNNWEKSEPPEGSPIVSYAIGVDR